MTITLNLILNKYFKLILFCSLLFIVTKAHAQENFNSSGGNFQGNHGNISFTIGQPFFEQHTNINGNVLEGVQQPYEISIVSVLIPFKDVIKVNYFPNPVSHSLNLKIIDSNLSFNNLYYKIFNLSGKIFKESYIDSNDINIKMDDLNSGTYFLAITSHKRQLKIIKIIKR